eukprot:2604204-Amphidinium_carterae.1
MSCSTSELANVEKQIAILEKLLANQPGQKPNIGTGIGTSRGGGKGAQTKSGGWWCSFCKMQNNWLTPSCFFCLKEKPQVDGPGRP